MIKCDIKYLTFLNFITKEVREKKGENEALRI